MMQNKSLDITRLQQGYLLDTRTYLSPELVKQYQYEEQCRAFTHFKSFDEGKSRQFICQFNSPAECRSFVNNYNEMIDMLAEQQVKINEVKCASSHLL